MTADDRSNARYWYGLEYSMIQVFPAWEKDTGRRVTMRAYFFIRPGRKLLPGGKG